MRLDVPRIVLAAIIALSGAGASAEPPDHQAAAVPARGLTASSNDISGYRCDPAAKVAKFRHARGGVTTNGTVTCLPEGDITAAHVVARVGGAHLRPTRHDMVWLSRRRALAPQPALKPGDRVTILGFAAGDRARPQRREGFVLKAWKPGEWLVKFDEGQPPTRNGMSGGAVLDAEGRVRGIVTTRNRKVDLDGDGQREQSSVIVDLAAWNAAGN